MKNEIWKPINGYEGLYEVSNLGNVRSLDRTIIRRGKTTKIAGRNIKLKKSKTGYLECCLSKNDKQTYRLVHRLVGETFLINPANLPQINHKNEDKTKNFVFVNDDGSIDYEKSNLEWCDAKYNMNYGARAQKVVKKRSKKIYQYDGDELVGIWQNAEIAANFLGIQRRHICSCCNGKRKTCGGYKWSYKKAV